MQENTKIIAVLTEEGDLNIHFIRIEQIEQTKQEVGMIKDSTAIFDILLSDLCYPSSIQWQEIKRVNFRF